MSWLPTEDPRCDGQAEQSPIDLLIVPRARDIGGFEVRRALPSPQRKLVGPFIFFDQMGPAEFITGEGIDVRPHPHIGLSTVTYLFEGSILHRDSLGSVQPIEPGAVNWMTAGKGIAHSERTGPEARASGQRLFGIQAWVALPQAVEETDPAFFHHPADTLPVVTGEGKTVRVITGSVFGATSPVTTASDCVYADIRLAAGTKLPIDPEFEERALYIVAGTVEIAGTEHPAGELLVLHPGDPITVTARADSHVMLFGGEPMDGPRYIWWNFVSSSKERIEAAKADWQAGRFTAVPGETEFIPLPER